jgi:hypothetical protein
MINKILANNTLSVLILAAAVILVAVLLLSSFQSTMDGIEWEEEIYKVRAGDSLWTISGDYCPDSVDRREWIDEVQALNDLPDSNIHPGQKLIVLAPVK